MEKWTEIKVTVSNRDVEKASGIANMMVDYGIYIEDYTDLEEMSWQISRIDLIDEDLKAKDRSKSVIHLYIPDRDNPREAVSYLTERLTAEKIDYTIELQEIKNMNWLDGWKKYFKPLEIGDRLAICPSWENYENVAMRKVLKIDPGAAFGTGTHETTQLCLSVLEETDCYGKKVLDIGCGSGILALSSVLLGSTYAVGVDIDPVAITTATENAAINGLSHQSTFICGDLVDKVSGQYDIICANIVADVIISLCDSVLDYMSEHSILILSGIIDTREEAVLDKINKSGMTVHKRYFKNGWVALVCVKGVNDD